MVGETFWSLRKAGRRGSQGREGSRVFQAVAAFRFLQQFWGPWSKVELKGLLFNLWLRDYSLNICPSRWPPGLLHLKASVRKEFVVSPCRNQWHDFQQ